MAMLVLDLKYMFFNEDYEEHPPHTWEVLAIRFLAAMFMHVIVEADIKHGLELMKYAINHRKRFTNVYAAFMFGFLQCSLNITLEINTIICLYSYRSVVKILTRYTSLQRIGNLPRYYYDSLDDSHILKTVKNYKLTLRNFRRDEPLDKAHWTIKYGLRTLYKIQRIYYVAVSYYFMPFTMMVLNIKYMAESAMYTTPEQLEKIEKEAALEEGMKID